MKIFHVPFINDAVFLILSVLQSGLAVIIFIEVLKGREKENLSREHIHFPGTVFLYLSLIVFVILSAYLPGRLNRKETEFLSSSIIAKRLESYSKDRFIDLNIVSRGPFKNYLGVRMSDGSYFKIMMKEGGDRLIMRASSEYSDTSYIDINGAEYILTKEESIIDLKIESEYMTVKSKSSKKYSQSAIYEIRYE